MGLGSSLKKFGRKVERGVKGDVNRFISNPVRYTVDETLRPFKDVSEGRMPWSGMQQTSRSQVRAGGPGGPIGPIKTPDLGESIGNVGAEAGRDLLGLNEPEPLNIGGSKAPDRPVWNSMIDPTTGLLKSQYQIQGPINTQGIEALRGEALRTGPSAWRTLSEQQEADRLAARQASNLTAAKNQLAATRGLSSGATERMMTRGMTEGLRARQDLAGKMALADEAKRMDTLAQLPGQELGLAQFQRGTNQMNIGNAMTEIDRKRQDDLSKWMKEMEVWGAERVARNTPSGGKK